MRAISCARMVTMALGALLGILAIPGTAQAQTLVPCSESALKTAIATANSGGGGTLVLTAGCTYVLTTPFVDSDGLPKITTPITIVGQGDTITRSTAVATPTFRIFEINAGGNLTLNVLTISNGRAPAGFSTARGGGIWLNGGGELTLNNGTITRNTADGIFGGGAGGVDNDGGRVTLNNSTISNNTGPIGGFDQDGTGASATFNNSTITGNTAQEGGGIWAEGSLTLNSTRVTNNTAVNPGAGVRTNGGTATLNNSTITGNTLTGAGGQGAGIFNPSGVTLTLNSTVVSNNTATSATSQGGGLFNNGTATLRSSRVTGNHAGNGGGIFNQTPGVVTLLASSVTGNTPNNCAPSGSVSGCVG